MVRVLVRVMVRVRVIVRGRHGAHTYVTRNRRQIPSALGLGFRVKGLGLGRRVTI